MVIEQPPNGLGTINDMWYQWIIDIGTPGPDRGEGGRYLLLPPGYDGPLPDSGFHVARSKTTRVLYACRAYLIDNDPKPTVENIKKTMKIYPYTPGGYGTSIATVLEGKVRLERNPPVLVDVTDLVREVLTILDLDLRAERVLVSTALQAGLMRVLADRVQLQQVLLNLITNAIESMRSVSDREHRLRISSEFLEDISEIRISIGDSGPGINRQDEKQIFEPFFSTKPTGMGIGLTICQSIVVSHGGSLRAIANKPHGTIFEIVLPAGGEHGS